MSKAVPPRLQRGGPGRVGPGPGRRLQPGLQPGHRRPPRGLRRRYEMQCRCIALHFCCLSSTVHCPFTDLLLPFVALFHRPFLGLSLNFRRPFTAFRRPLTAHRFFHCPSNAVHCLPTACPLAFMAFRRGLQGLPVSSRPTRPPPPRSPSSSYTRPGPPPPLRPPRLLPTLPAVAAGAAAGEAATSSCFRWSCPGARSRCRSVGTAGRTTGQVSQRPLEDSGTSRKGVALLALLA